MRLKGGDGDRGSVGPRPGPGLGIRGTQKKSGLKVEFYKSLEPGKNKSESPIGRFLDKFKPRKSWRGCLKCKYISR